MISSLCARGEKTARIIGQVRKTHLKMGHETNNLFSGDRNPEEHRGYGPRGGNHPDAAPRRNDRGKRGKLDPDDRQEPEGGRI